MLPFPLSTALDSSSGGRCEWFPGGRARECVFQRKRGLGSGAECTSGSEASAQVLRGAARSFRLFLRTDDNKWPAIPLGLVNAAGRSGKSVPVKAC